MFRFLIADPFEAIRDITGITLEREGHEVIMARDPDEVRSALELYQFDVVIMDVIMYPGLPQGGAELRRDEWTGIELVREMRAHQNTCLATITILNTVANRHVGIEELALAAGADLVLAKVNLPDSIRATLKFAHMRAAS